jgi:hypothetical protein
MALRQPLDTALSALKASTGLVNRGQINLMYLFEPQFRNNFEVTFVPRFTAQSSRTTSLNPLDAIQSSSNLPAENSITTFNLQTASIPQIGFEYERRQEQRFVKDIIHPDNVIMSFIEEERGLVKKWIESMMQEIVIRDPRGGFVFQDKQENSKRDAIIKVKGGLGANSPLQPAGWIKLEGLKYESVDEQSFEQGSGDAQIFSITFSLDTAWYISI